MNRIFQTLLFSSLLSPVLFFGQIIETAHFSDLPQYVTAKTLVICDIDDTLLIPVQTLGSDVWFLSRVEYYKSEGMKKNEALERALSEWEAIRKLTGVELVEEGSDEIIEELQSKNIPIIGLTTQGLSLASCTVEQLNSLGFNFLISSPSKEDYYFINEHGVLFRKGILFTSGTAKGKALLKLLDLMDFHPEHILFINDKLTHLKDVESAVESAGISFTGLRYSFSDERVAQYDQEIADIQWFFSSFEKILSDEEALILKGELQELVNSLL